MPRIRLTSLLLALTVACAAPAFPASILEKDPVFVQSFDLNTDERYVYANVLIDRVRGHVYFITAGGPAYLVKYRLATESTPAQRIGAVELPANAAEGDCAALDVDNGHIYIATYSEPAILVKVSVGEPDAAPTVLGSLTFEASENYSYSLAVDFPNRHAYIACYFSPGAIVKCALGEGDALPTRLGSLVCAANEHYPYAMTINPQSGKGWYFSYDTDPYGFCEFNLGAGTAPPTRVAFYPQPATATYSYYRARFEPLTQTVLFFGSYPSLGFPVFLKWDVSGPTPREIGRSLAVDPQEGSAAFDADFASGLMFTAPDRDDARLSKWFYGRRLSAPGALAVTAIPPGNDIYIESIGYDPDNRFIYCADDQQSPGRIYVFRQPAGDGPDLSGAFLKASQKGTPGKASVRGQVSVSNSSTQDTGLFFVRFYLSDDRELSADDVQIGKDRLIKTLKAGKTRKIGFAAGKLPQSAQGKHVIAVIDPQGLVDSANRGTQRIVSSPLP